MNPLNVALSGIEAADHLAEVSATRTAHAFQPGQDADLAKEMENLELAQIQQRASVKVAETVSETLGTLVDTFA
jgi:flagellin-like hook-associated protein FlgL